MEEIAEVISKYEPGVGPGIFASQLSEKFQIPDMREIAMVAFSFGSLLIAADDGTEQLSQALAQSYYTQFEKEAEKNYVDSLAKKIHLLLQKSDPLKTYNKALGLIAESDKLFRDCRIISDIRLLFQESISKESNHAIVLHQLKIEYQTNEELKSAFFNLKREELEQLKKQVDRALEKETSIYKNFPGIQFIQLKN
ncbi:MAG: hypothetical protein WD077_05885 [Bacteroidia bacterium]